MKFMQNLFLRILYFFCKQAPDSHRAEIVDVKLSEHPDADALSIVHIGGFRVVVRTEDWIGVNKGVYIQPETLVPNEGPFKFLFEKKGEKKYDINKDGYAIKNKGGTTKDKDGNEIKKEAGKYVSIRVAKLRGQESFGLLAPVPSSPWYMPWRKWVGYDAAKLLNVKHYEPMPHFRRTRFGTISLGGGWDNAPTPDGWFIPVTSIKNLRHNVHVFKPGDKVVVTEKIHGENGRFTYRDGEFHCGSHRTWKKDDEKSQWWMALRNTEGLEDFLRDNPGVVVYGEVFPRFAHFTYGKMYDKPQLLVFGIMIDGVHISFDDMETLLAPYCVPTVPVLARLVLDNNYLVELEKFAIGNSTFCEDHIREGIVVQCADEKPDRRVGRRVFKLKSFEFLRNH